MSSTIMAISSSPTSVRASRNCCIIQASPWLACSTCVFSCTPLRAVPGRPENAAAAAGAARWIAIRALSSIASWCCVSSKSRFTSNLAPALAMWSASSRMSASSRPIVRRNCSSVIATAPFVRSVR